VIEADCAGDEVMRHYYYSNLEDIGETGSSASGKRGVQASQNLSVLPKVLPTDLR
jgi:hypothetical protein